MSGTFAMAKGPSIKLVRDIVRLGVHGIPTSLEAWMRGQRREPAGPLRQVLIADQRTAAPDTLVCDLSVPLTQG